MVAAEVYLWLTIAVIGFLILLMSFFGGHDFGGGGDVGGDFGGHEIGGGGGDSLAGVTSPGLSPLSLPMIAAFLATAGAVGAGLSIGGYESSFSAIVAIVAGILVFLGAFIFVAKFLGEGQSSSLIHEKEYEGKTGTVTETITEQGVGAVAVTVRGTRYVVSARSNGQRIPAGREVLIKRVAESVASVQELKTT